MNTPIPPPSLTSWHPDAVQPADRPLIDASGRRVSYVRLSVTDRCDFRCHYCMAEKMTFLPRNEVLSLEECLRLVRLFVERGVDKVRITGGEPLVRKDILWLIERLGALPGLAHLVMTTNGSQLKRYAAPLRAAGVERLNISLDTLSPQTFGALTRIGELEKVLRGIDAAIEAGFVGTKLNTVMMRGINDHEFVDLVRFAIARELDISFIEEMPLGPILGRSQTFMPAQDALNQLGEHFDLRPTQESSGGPARYWRVPGSRTRIGFITPQSEHFCETCNRVRITARGELYPCLGHNDAVALLPLLRAHAEDGPVAAAIARSLALKPEGHRFNEQIDNPQVVRFMSMTGG